MSDPKKPIIIDGFDAIQNHKICLTDENGKHFFHLHNILYAKGEGCYTTFYFLDKQPNNKEGKIVTSHNLGYYSDMLFDYGFAQANQRIVFNVAYLDTITRSNEVVLTHKHELIQVTPSYRVALYELLKIDVG